jgi:SNF2 family DNA or RNA helicase
LKHVRIDEEKKLQEDRNFDNIDNRHLRQNDRIQRKPPRGKNLQCLEDFSWSSSDEESEGSYSTSCLSKTDTPKQSVEDESITPRRKRESRAFRSSSVGFSTIFSSDRKVLDQTTSSRSTKLEPFHPKRASRAGVSPSDSSSVSLSILSSSDDEFSISSTESDNVTSKKKTFSWSFNKNRREYTIGGNSKLPAFSIPSDLYDQLYDFQKDGVAWMAGLHLPKVGGILGDDMGMVNSTQRFEHIITFFISNNMFSPHFHHRVKHSQHCHS